MMNARVWSTEAIEVSYLLRRRSLSEVTVRNSWGCTLAQTSLVALEEVFTEPSISLG